MKASTILRALLPLAVLGAGVLAAKTLIDMRPEPEHTTPEPVVPLVQTVAARASDEPLEVVAHGTVVPRVETELVAEVAGRIVSVSPAMVAGGFFEEGDLLLEIDPVDYELAVARARLEVARAARTLAQEEAAAATARREWSELGRGEGTPLALHEPQLAEAQASLEAARAALAKAEHDLARTRVVAPYAGRVRSESVDVGRYVAPGTPLARIFAIDRAEVRLPISDRELAFLALPLDGEPPAGDGAGDGGAPRVTLVARIAGQDHTWSARIVRTEAELDPRTRMLVAVAEVADPYDRADRREGPPLAVGQFVEARIEGLLARDVFALPRRALRDGDRVFLLGTDGRLAVRDVHVLRRERERVLVDRGLADGEPVITSPLELAIPGMRVRAAGSEESER